MLNLGDDRLEQTLGCENAPSQSGTVESTLGQSNDLRQWTIKGLAPETVQVSREAAKRSGMKLNSWVGMALQKAAETPIVSDASLGVANKDEELADIRNELAKIRAQGEALESTINSISSLLLKLYDKNNK